MELGTLYLENKKGLCISRPDAKPQKHHLRAPLRYIIHRYTYLVRATYESVYMYLGISFNTYLLTHYLPRISTNKSNIHLPILNQILPKSLESSTYLTYLVHTTNHLTFSYRPLYPPVLYTHIHRGRVSPQAGSVPDCNRNFRLLQGI